MNSEYTKDILAVISSRQTVSNLSIAIPIVKYKFLCTNFKY
jgi:hypothetical protein